MVGLDDLNDFYGPARKLANLSEVRECGAGAAFDFVKGDVRDADLVNRVFGEYAFDMVVHLAAMPGVRRSIEHPHLNYSVNLGGTLVLLDASVGRLTAGRQPRPRIGSFIFGSTSSVYGATTCVPFVESDPCDRPLTPYPASKRAAELLGYSYHHLYGLNFTALRFFTVYGPRGRPDMMPYKLADNIHLGRSVPLYNEGNIHRDWTYVDDVVSGIVAAVDRPFGYEIINLGRGEPILLSDFVRTIEDLTGRKTNLVAADAPKSEMLSTHADISRARCLLGYNPTVSIGEGVSRFVAWYEKAVLKGGNGGGGV